MGLMPFGDEIVTSDNVATQSPHRVAMLANLFHPVVSGSSTQVAGLSRALANRGHHVVVITAHVDNSTPPHEVIDGYEVYRVPALHLPKMEIALSFPWLNWVLWPRNLNRIADIIKTHQIDVIHVHNHMFDMAFVAAILKRRLNLPMILTMHTVIKHANAFYNAVLQFLDRYLLGPLVISNADIVVCPDNNMKSYLEHRFSRLDSSLATYGVDPPREVSDDELKKLRDKYQLHHRQVIVSIGHVHAIRNRHELLRALPSVIARVPNVKLVIVGGVFSETPERLVEELGISSHVVFAGAQERDKISAFLKVAEVEAHWLNQDEGTWASPGLASMEAMYAGLPVLTVANETIYGSGVLEEGKNIVLVQREQIEALSQRLIELLTNQELAKSIGAAAAETCEAHFSWPRTADRTAAIYCLAVQNAG